MKRLITTITTLLCFASWLSAMDYETAREQAYYLTDKMAYELNLNQEQYDDAFEINLDYLLSINDEKDIDAAYLTYRNEDLRLILLEWQWEAFVAATYFWHPVYWVNGGWYFPVLRYYDPTRFFYPRPSIFWDYRGAHGRSHFVGGSYYANRRPAWNGGLRGNSSTKVKRPAGSGSGQRGSTAVSHASASATSHTPSGSQRGNTKAAGSRGKTTSQQGMRSSSRNTVNNNNRARSSAPNTSPQKAQQGKTSSSSGARSSAPKTSPKKAQQGKTSSPSGARSSAPKTSPQKAPQGKTSSPSGARSSAPKTSPQRAPQGKTAGGRR